MPHSDFDRGAARLSLRDGPSVWFGGASPTSAAADEESGVQGWIIVESIRRDIQTRRLCDYLPIYLLFVVLFAFQVWLEHAFLRSPMFYRNIETLRMLHAVPEGVLNEEAEDFDDAAQSEFHRVGSYGDFWDWLDKALISVWPQGTKGGPRPPGTLWIAPNSSSPPSVNVPLGYLVLRQLRVEAGECDHGLSHVLPSNIRTDLGKVRKRCYPEYSGATASIEDYGDTAVCGGGACDAVCCKRVDELMGTASCAAAGSPTAAPSPTAAGAPGTLCGTSVAPPWRANIHFRNATRPPDSVPRYGAADQYPHPSQSFTQLIPFDQSLSDGLRSLCYLKQQNWIDDGTRGVFTEIVTYNQVSDVYVFSSLLVERLASNSYMPSAKSTAFQVLSLSATSNSQRVQAILWIDVLLFVLFTCDLSRMICVARWDVTLVDRNMFWRMWGLVHFCVFFFAWWLRLQLWLMAWGMGEGWFEDNDWRIRPDGAGFADGSPEHQCAQTRFMWEQLSEYAGVYDTESSLIAICVVVVVVRLLEFGTVGKVNILTETLSLAGSDLASVLLLVAVVVVGFGTSAHILFGDSIEHYSHLWISFGSLLQTLASGDSPDFDAMQQQHLWGARFLVFLFYTLAWLILLNMILAIIISSFETVQDSDPGDGKLLEILGDRFSFRQRRRKSYWRVLGFVGAGCADLACWAVGRERGRPSKEEEEQAGDDGGGEGGWIQTRTEVAERLRHRGVRKWSEDAFCEEFGDWDEAKQEHLKGIYKSAARAAQAQEDRVNRGDMWARSLSKKWCEAHKLQTSMDKLFKAGETLREDVKALDAVNRDLKSKDEALGTLESAVGDVLENLEKGSQLQMVAGDREYASHLVQQLREASAGIAECLEATKQDLEQRTSRVVREVQTGTLWGPPSRERRALVLPRLKETIEGQDPASAVKDVRVYAYPEFPKRPAVTFNNLG